MIRLRHILIGILASGVLTVWIKDRWAQSVLQTMVFLCAARLSLRIAWKGYPTAADFMPLFPAGMAFWSTLQLAAHWTAVRSDTTEALLYWLAAASLVWLGLETCATREERRPFLRTSLIAGSIICLSGLVQLYTSEGRIFWLFPSGYSSLVFGPFVSQNNYAAFVELLLPISLALASQDRHHSRAYLIVAAALAASVIASGSRAGSTIVIAEAALVFLLQRRADKEATGRRWVTFAVVAAAFTTILGYQYLWDRLSKDKDPYLVRREFLESSIAMIRAQPLHGFGLGAWANAYKQFAIIDTGAVANHAHNEWAQWAAEGGLPAFAAMLALLLFCVPSAIRSVWGLGIVAVFVHALLDYPFLRLGLAAWIFVMIGALAGYRGERQRVDRGQTRDRRSPGFPARVTAAMTVPLFIFGMYQSFKIGWADNLYHRDTAETVARAANWWPDQAEYQFSLAQIDTDHAVRHLQRAVALNPFLTTARIALASQMESSGDTAGAEAALLEAARRDRQYAPAWALANFYFRAGRPDRFWQWARTATEISYGGLRPLFDLSFAVTADAQVVFDREVVSRRIVEREYLQYLIDENRISDARAPALRIAASANEEDRDALLDYVDRALDSGQLEAAVATWDSLALRHLMPYGVSKPGVLVNGDFRQPILNHAFDWRTPATSCAVAARTLIGGPALEVSFSGTQPENCESLYHFLPVTRGVRYVLRFQYQTQGLPEQTGLHWSVGSGADHELTASDDWSTGEWHFQAPADVVRLVLAYCRAPGTRRIEGTILLRHVRLDDERSLGEVKPPYV